MRTLEEIKRTVETGLGRFPCELKLANVQLVNVFSGEIYPTDIYIQNKRVVSIEPGLTLEAEKNVDCGGAYAVPGFIDSHMHFESTMLSPEALVFEKFMNEDAYQIGTKIKQGVEKLGHDVVDSISLGDEHLFYYAMQSIRPINLS